MLLIRSIDIYNRLLCSVFIGLFIICTSTKSFANFDHLNFKEIIIQEGDNLSSLLRKNGYDLPIPSELESLIFQINPKLKDFDVLFPGDKILMPVLTTEPQENSSGLYFKKETKKRNDVFEFGLIGLFESIHSDVEGVKTELVSDLQPGISMTLNKELNKKFDYLLKLNILSKNI